MPLPDDPFEGLPTSSAPAWPALAFGLLLLVVVLVAFAAI